MCEPTNLHLAMLSFYALVPQPQDSQPEPKPPQADQPDHSDLQPALTE